MSVLVFSPKSTIKSSSKVTKIFLLFNSRQFEENSFIWNQPFMIDSVKMFPVKWIQNGFLSNLDENDTGHSGDEIKFLTPSFRNSLGLIIKLIDCPIVECPFHYKR